MNNSQRRVLPIAISVFLVVITGNLACRIGELPFLSPAGLHLISTFHIFSILSANSPPVS
jgi:hypothetical protein